MSATRARAAALLFALGAALAAAAAQAFDPLGFYLGAGVGQSNVRSTRPLFDAPVDFVKHRTGWKLLAGVKFIPLLGAEVEYLDFGQATVQLSPFVGTEIKARGPAAFALLYAPIPVPDFDLYAKAGVAALRTRVASASDTRSSFAFGVGAQLHFSAFALRAEYERVQQSDGDPDLFSVGLTWRPQLF